MDTAFPAARRNAPLGAAAIAFAIAFNIPFATLSATFEYPDVLRRPAGEVLTLFHAGGAPLILTWHAFAIAALMFVPLAIALSLDTRRIATHPALAAGAAITGSLAGLAQAIGLWRWVFVVPSLASAYVDPAATEAARAAAENTFALINLYGGVAIGEHLGQLLTALFVLLLALLQLREGGRITPIIGFVAAAAILLGTNEGLAIALGRSGEFFGLVTIAGFLGLSAWLVATGVGLLRGR
ncbi:MAG: DUF4386 family protein [Mesorhizobium sp.]|nr:DUF4386 family protein [Mesorhizobium sp.]